MNKSLITKMYEELIISILVLSYPPEKQIEITGYGCVGDEIVTDFDCYYNSRKEEYKHNGMFNDNEFKALDEFDEYLVQIANKTYPEFYTHNEELFTNPIWGDIRQKAKQLLLELGKDNFTVGYTREEDKHNLDKTFEVTRRVLTEE